MAPSCACVLSSWRRGRSEKKEGEKKGEVGGEESGGGV